MSAIEKMSNRLRMVSSYYTNADEAAWPQEVVIELTNHCNLACVMCEHPNMKRDKGFMNEETFKSIVHQIKDKCDSIYLHGYGESLLHKRVAEYADYAAAHGLTTVLATNALPFTEASATALLGSRVDHLIIAIDGASKETYENIRLKGNFDRLISIIKMLLRRHRELSSDVKITLQTIAMEQNSDDEDAYRKLFTKEEWAEVFQFRRKPLYETFDRSSRSVQHKRPCFWLWNMMSIAWNGNIQLCCTDYESEFLEMNVKDAPLIELWNSEKMKELRRKHKALELDDIPLCAGCDIPIQGYFNTATILASSMVSANTVRRLLPVFEKYFLLR